MIVLAALLVVVCLLMFGLVLFAAFTLTDKRNATLAELVAAFGDSLEKVSLRESSDIKAVLDAALDGRRQLVNALVATAVDPRAAQRLAIIERDAEAAERPPVARDLLAELRETAVGGLNRDYPTDSDGLPVQLVGAGG